MNKVQDGGLGTVKTPRPARAKTVPRDKRERMLDAAEAIIATDGLRALKVRDVASAAGTSLGGVYLFFEDLDALILAVNQRTLLRLDARLAAVDGAPKAAIHALARAYLGFAADQPKLLRALFEHRMQENRSFPDDLLDKVNAMFAYIAGPLSSILIERSAAETSVIARTMFSGFHGIVMMGLEERIVAVPTARLHEQVTLFVEAFLSGLPGALQSGKQTPPAYGSSSESQ
jgi:AcrR family transcriptional regulator